MAKKNPYNNLRKFDLELRDDSYYDDYKGKYHPAKNFYIGTQSDSSVGMYGTIEGKSGKIYGFKEKEIDKILNDKNKLSKIAKDLYGE